MIRSSFGDDLLWPLKMFVLMNPFYHTPHFQKKLPSTIHLYCRPEKALTVATCQPCFPASYCSHLRTLGARSSHSAPLSGYGMKRNLNRMPNRHIASEAWQPLNWSISRVAHRRSQFPSPRISRAWRSDRKTSSQNLKILETVAFPNIR